MANKKTRVVAYARVSTDAQVKDGNSLENQRSYFERELSKQQNYKLVSLPTNDNGIYVDEGVSGTKIKRPAFDRMLRDAGLQLVISARTDKETDDYEIISEPKFDLIYVKDISRFARNVSVDKLLKTLLQNGVAVHFLDLNKRSDSNEDMTYIQIFLSFSERESRDRSVKTKFGHKEAHRRGDIAVGGKMYGYRYVKKRKNDPYNSGYYQIDEDEAVIVKKIYNYYTEDGYGDFRICQLLYEEGILNRAGKKFTTNSIARILKNEKYTGVNDAGKFNYGADIFHKKITDVPYEDADRQLARDATQRLKDEGIIDRIPQLISVEQFQKAQEIRQNHSDIHKVKKCVYNGTTPYVQKIKCSECGSFYFSNGRKNIDGVRYRRYACKQGTHFNGDTVKKCMNPSVYEIEFDKLLDSDVYFDRKLNEYEEVLGAVEVCLATLEEAIDSPKEELVSELIEERKAIEAKKDKLLPLYIDGEFSKEQLDALLIQYNTQLKQLNEIITANSKGNSSIREIIENLTDVKAELEAEYSSLQQPHEREYILNASDEELSLKERQRVMDLRRRKKLRDVECIYVDTFGNLTAQFKHSEDLEELTDYLDHLIETYSHMQTGKA